MSGITPAPLQVAHADISVLPDKEKDVAYHVETLDDVESNKRFVELTAIEGAIAAEVAEQSMTFREAWRDYRTAVLWSLGISLCIIMEGYDTALPVSPAPATELTPGQLCRPARVPQKVWSLRQRDRRLPAVPIVASRSRPDPRNRLDPSHRRVGLGAAALRVQESHPDRTLRDVLLHLHRLLRPRHRHARDRTAPVCLGLVRRHFDLTPDRRGAFQATCVSYASEIAPVALRGYLTTYVNLCWIIGQFIAAGVLKAMSPRTDEWAFRIPFAIQWVWPIPLMILIHFAPESPWYLIRAGKLEEAAAAVVRIQKKGSKVDPRHTVAMMVRTDEHEKSVSAGTRFIDCFKGSDLRRTEIACVVWASQTLAG